MDINLKINFGKPASLLTFLICLTLLCVAGQITFFIIHYNVSDLVDSLVQSSLKSEIFHPVILIPLGNFLLIQLLSYAVIVVFIWFLTNALSELFSLSNRIVLGCLIWLTTFTAILCLNNF